MSSKLISFVIIFIVLLSVKLYLHSLYPAYNPETASHLLEIIKLNEGKLILEGPLTSKDWLRLSSFSYYFIYPILFLTNFHPLTLSIAWVIVNVISVFLLFFISKKIFNLKTALISASLFYISPMSLYWDSVGGVYPFVIPLSIIFYYLIYKLIFKNKKNLFLILFLLSMMFSLHASSLILLLPLLIIILFKYKLFKIKNYLYAIFAFLIPQLPLILIDIQNNFDQLKSLSLWIPYKLFNFLKGSSLGVEKNVVEDNSLNIIFEFIHEIFLPVNQFNYLSGVFILGIMIMFYLVLKKFRNKKYLLFLFILIISLLQLFIHKNPPIHYFVPIFILPIILFSYVIASTKKWGILIFIFLLILNMQNIYTKFSNNKDISRYEKVKIKSEQIVSESKGKEFSIYRIGPFDNYPNRFQDDYEYMIRWLGGNLNYDSENIYYILDK